MCNKIQYLLLMLSTLVSVQSETNSYYAPSIFVNHGGGPNPVLREKNNIEMADAMEDVINHVDFDKLKAIIVVTAHWEEDVVSISSGEHHEIIYDYSNFPPQAYKFKYNAPGYPELARKVHEALKKEGVSSRLDDKRGWDHGTFIPMMLIRPAADIPIVQVSILKNQDAQQHYKVGEVLHQFREQGILILGSGMSYHNMGELNKALKKSDEEIVNQEFDKFLDDVCTGSVEGRKEKIINWKDEKEALEAHPLHEADHFMPLVVNAGAGGDSSAQNIFKGIFLGKFIVSGYIWK